MHAQTGCVMMMMEIFACHMNTKAKLKITSGRLFLCGRKQHTNDSMWPVNIIVLIFLTYRFTVRDLDGISNQNFIHIICSLVSFSVCFVRQEQTFNQLH